MTDDPRSGEPEGPPGPAFFQWLLQLVEQGDLDATGPVGAGLVRRLEGAAAALEVSAGASSLPVDVEVDQDGAGSLVRLRRGKRVVIVAVGLDKASAVDLCEQLVRLFGP